MSASPARMALPLLVTLLCPSTPLPAESNRTVLRESVARAEAMAKRVTITRDEFGVPHVHGDTDAAAVFGGMYARAEDEMSHIEAAYAAMIGRGALIGGKAREVSDHLVLAFEVPERAQREYPDVPVEVRALLDAGADALNLYLQRHRDYKPAAIDVWEPWMLLAFDYSWALT